MAVIYDNDININITTFLRLFGAYGTGRLGHDWMIRYFYEKDEKVVYGLGR